MTRDRDYYRQKLNPVYELIEDAFIKMEAKHGKGLHFSDFDAHKAISHMEKFQRGEYNPDGISHSTAAVCRAIKVELARLAMEDAA